MNSLFQRDDVCASCPCEVNVFYFDMAVSFFSIDAGYSDYGHIFYNL